MIKLFFLSLLFCGNVANAGESLDSFQEEMNFLNSLLEDEETFSPHNYREVSQSDLNIFANDIKSAKNSLESIKIEKFKKKEGNEEEIQKLIDEYNRKMQDLKKSYQFIVSKSRHKVPEQRVFSSLNSLPTINSLNNQRKGKLIGKEELEPLEVVVLPGRDNSIDPEISKENRDLITGEDR